MGVCVLCLCFYNQNIRRSTSDPRRFFIKVVFAEPTQLGSASLLFLVWLLSGNRTFPPPWLGWQMARSDLAGDLIHMENCLLGSSDIGTQCFYFHGSGAVRRESRLDSSLTSSCIQKSSPKGMQDEHRLGFKFQSTFNSALIRVFAPEGRTLLHYGQAGMKAWVTS